MLKIVYPICCGIDVHKKFLVACIAFTNDKGVTTYKSSRFSTFTNGLRKLSDGFAPIPAHKFAWNLPANIGSLCTIFWNPPVKSHWPTQSM
jgi:chitinase